jgi:hypothetical protein
MKLSERIAALQAALALYGDTDVLRFDMEQGYDETFTAPELCKRIDGDIITEFDYWIRVKAGERRQEFIDTIDESWDKIDNDLRSSWGSKERFVEQLMQPINNNDRILAAWPTAPVVLVI